MSLTRRDIHKGFAALVVTAFSARSAFAETGGKTGFHDDIFLNRMTFGATPELRAEIQAKGRAAWLDEQLAMPAVSPDLQARLDKAQFLIEYDAGASEIDDGTVVHWDEVEEHRPFAWLNSTSEELVTLLDWNSSIAIEERSRPAREVRAAAFIRVVHAPAQLREVMAQFWLNHFSVNSDKDEITASIFPVYDRDMREHAFGNFRDLLGASAMSPVMLHYLNNDESQASPANENYARELLELHTMGQGAYFNDLYDNWRDVPGALEGLAQGYIDDDVYEVARALTGWSIGDGRAFGDQSYTPMSGKLAYIEGWHDPYQKRILGVEFEANAGPMEDGIKVLDMLAQHPATARFVTEKIIRRLGIEAPSDTYKAVIAAVFLDEAHQPDQIARVIRAIVAHPEFDVSPATKLRLPFEFLAAYLRATGAEVSPTDSSIEWTLKTAGWKQHMVAPPTGHSDHTIDWADTRTISGIMNLALDAHGEWSNLTDDVLLRRVEGLNTIAELAANWAGRFGIEVDAMAPVIEGLGFEPGDETPKEEDWYEWINTAMVVFAALDTSFLYR